MGLSHCRRAAEICKCLVFVSDSEYHNKYMLEQLDSIIGEDSGLRTIRNSVSHCQGQPVEEKGVIIRSNTLRTSFSSPICRLPSEILSEIFLYCLPKDKNLTYTSRQAPMLLTSMSPMEGSCCGLAHVMVQAAVANEIR
jgi:hypothetical protein